MPKSSVINSIKAYIILFAFMQLCSCKPMDVYEKSQVVPGHEWASSKAIEGSFEITDTIPAYQIYIVLRHTDEYTYNNIWLNMGLQSPGDSMYDQKVNLSLGNDAQGWEGTGMNDIWELRKPLIKVPRRCIRPGVYKYRIRQIMRDDPLPHIMSVGLRVERAP